MRGQIVPWRRQTKILLIGSGCANERFKKTRTLEPPMAEQLRIERHNDNWIDIVGRELTELRAALLQKMHGVRISGYFSRGAIVQILVFFSSGNAVIFHAGKFANAARDWSKMFERQIKPDVAIKFAIGRIARITFLRA